MLCSETHSPNVVHCGFDPRSANTTVSSGIEMTTSHLKGQLTACKAPLLALMFLKSLSLHSKYFDFIGFLCAQLYCGTVHILFYIILITTL